MVLPIFLHFLPRLDFTQAIVVIKENTKSPRDSAMPYPGPERFGGKLYTAAV